MKKLSIFILLLSILNNLLFFNQRMGINVIIFFSILLCFIYFFFKKENMINNKKGLLYLIPIFLIGISYSIYDNTFFRIFNLIVICFLLLLTCIYTIRPTYHLGEIIGHCISIVFDALSKIDDFLESFRNDISDIFKMSDNNKRIFKSIIIVVPIVIVVLLLLSSADMIFGNIFKDFVNVFKNISIDTIIDRFVWIAILFIYGGAVLTYLLNDYRDVKIQAKPMKKIDSYTIKLLLVSLNIIYLIFDFIQIRSLIFHNMSMDIPYSTYARQGFFQLMGISIFNIIVLLLTKKTDENKFIKGNSLLMVVLTFIIIVSSFLRMSMYEAAYGYTLLRLLVYVSLITEVIMLIPTIIYIIKDKFNIIRSYIIIITCCYTILSLFPVDYFIAKNNIDRFYKSEKIDVYYLMNNGYDNIPLLIELENKLDNTEDKDALKEYINSMKTRSDNIFEYNYSRANALKKIKSK